SINYAKTISLSPYTQTSVDALFKALTVAETVYADENATQQQVDDADLALRISINNLKSYKIDLDINPDLDKVSSRVEVNVLVSFSNLGTEDIAELILTDNLGFYRNVGSVKAADSKVYNLSYIMPAEFQANSYTLTISAVAKYADGTTNSVSKSVDFKVTDLSADKLDQVRKPQLAQNVEKDEPVTKHNLELPKTGEHNYYYVSLALILILGILIRKRAFFARN
ncbi:MAG: LPXTG cell wall anchor domain-containing protein, partial [Saccharofermentanales bacterium]